jgi:adenylate cyclase
MPLAEFLADEKSIEVQPGETLLQAAQRADIALAHICGGKARCSTCRIIVLEGLENCSPRTGPEQEVAGLLGFSPQVRLACQTLITGPVKIRRLVVDEEDLELGTLFIKEGKPELGGVEKEIFILFADIIGFTAFAESLLPYDVIHILNRYFHLTGGIIEANGGHIDTYMGDGFMALFETDDPPEGALRAIQAGLEILVAVDRLQPYLEKLYQRSFKIRLGLHFGQVVAGTVGSPKHKKMTVIGDAVNLASRIEAANKEAGTHFLISEDAYALVRDQIRVKRRLTLSLPGKSGAYNLYEVTGF